VRRVFIAGHDWLTVVRLPPYAPDLNPVEGIWSLLRRGPLANAIFTDPGHLIATIRRACAVSSIARLAWSWR
jgi:transposase